ncbi:hypothetical protein TNCV_4219291 [Trichonephila clavipes]|nr:hypothetical protein TNCV_4219291 [Trichonephila clavipes]
MLNQENILLLLRCCQLSLFDQPESILPPVDQLILSRSKLDDLFDHQQFLNGFAKISSPNCTVLYKINSIDTVKKLSLVMYVNFAVTPNTRCWWSGWGEQGGSSGVDLGIRLYFIITKRVGCG